MPRKPQDPPGPTYAEHARTRANTIAGSHDDLARKLHDDAGHFGAFAFCDEPACVDIARAAR